MKRYSKFKVKEKCYALPHDGLCGDCVSDSMQVYTGEILQKTLAWVDYTIIGGKLKREYTFSLIVYSTHTGEFLLYKPACLSHNEQTHKVHKIYSQIQTN